MDSDSLAVRELRGLMEAFLRADRKASRTEASLRKEIDDLTHQYEASIQQCSELISPASNPYRQIEDYRRVLLESNASLFQHLNDFWQLPLQHFDNEGVLEAAALAEESLLGMEEKLGESRSARAKLEQQVWSLKDKHRELTLSIMAEERRTLEYSEKLIAAQKDIATYKARAEVLQAAIMELR